MQKHLKERLLDILSFLVLAIAIAIIVMVAMRPP